MSESKTKKIGAREYTESELIHIESLKKQISCIQAELEMRYEGLIRQLKVNEQDNPFLFDYVYNDFELSVEQIGVPQC